MRERTPAPPLGILDPPPPGPTPPPAPRPHDRPRSAAPFPLRWWLRQMATIGLVHALALLLTFLLLALGEALFTSYLIVLKDSVFVSYLTQASWLKSTAIELRGGIAFVVAANAVLQMLVLTWQARAR